MKGLFVFSAALGAANAFVARGYSNTTQEMTTSTIYATRTYTVTDCPVEVTDCPKKPRVTTETIAISTTICPVTELPKTTTWVPPPHGGNVTSTLYTTKTYVITSCPPEVPDCPKGHTTTTIIPTATTCITYPPAKPTCHGDECKPAPPPKETKPVPPPKETPCKGDDCDVPPAVTTPKPQPTKDVCKGDDCAPPPVVTAAAGRAVVEIAAAAAGVAAFFL